jgi:hypothetical protein
MLICSKKDALLSQKRYFAEIGGFAAGAVIFLRDTNLTNLYRS